MVWGSMAQNGVGKLVFIDHKMNADISIDLMKRKFKPSTKKFAAGNFFIMQQNNDIKHTSKKIEDYFDQNHVKMLDQPSKSPDMNLIEHLWSIVQRKIGERRCKTKDELKAKVQEAWNQISPKETKELVESMHNHIQEVLRERGGSPRY